MVACNAWKGGICARRWRLQLCRNVHIVLFFKSPLVVHLLCCFRPSLSVFLYDRPGWGAQDFMAVNLAHGQLRRRLVTPDKMVLVEETIGKQGADRFLDSGITGVTPGKVRAFEKSILKIPGLYLERPSGAGCSSLFPLTAENLHHRLHRSQAR